MFLMKSSKRAKKRFCIHILFCPYKILLEMISFLIINNNNWILRLYYCWFRITDLKNKKPLQGNNWSSQLHILPLSSFLFVWNLQRNTGGLNESYETHLIRQKVAFTRVRLCNGFYNPSNWTEVTWTQPGFYRQTPAACWFEQLLKINRTLPLLRQAVIRAGGGGAG